MVHTATRVMSLNLQQQIRENTFVRCQGPCGTRFSALFTCTSRVFCPERGTANAPQELQSFLADLNQWTGDVKEKDKALREGRVQQGAGSSQAAQRAAPPPIRGRAPLPPENAVLAKPLTREKKDDGSSAKSGSAAAHTYDSYRERWCAVYARNICSCGNCRLGEAGAFLSIQVNLQGEV